MKRLAVLAAASLSAIAVAAVVVATASGGAQTQRTPAKTKKTINIAVFLASAANTYAEATRLGAQDAAKKAGNVKLTIFDGQFNTNKQLGELRDALVSKKYDAWLVYPNDGGPLTQTIKKAISQGVKVGCVLVPCGPDVRQTKVQIPGQVVFDGVGFFRNGQLLGKLVEQGCKGISSCEVFWMPGLPTLPLEQARTAGLKSVISKDKNIKIVATQAGGYLAAPALTATQNVLQAHPNLNVIVSSGDQMIAGAVRAEAAAGKSGIKMYGNGCTFEAKQLILQGKQTGCMVYLPRTEGRTVTSLLIKAVNGSKRTGISLDPLSESPIGPLGTKANIAKFNPEFHS
ncbi:MAG TPA: sugar ABC transporter substrate-binding protein [Gaiellaceae bacterium]|jgi:ribose transport system substrate-binding protein|nr:sugar ABC transporter substrate-binding protein [Gaiellaceae bacterium]HVY77375.1 sugar ABC transporter substrate-binding protein [Solirubrobacterales bacterium]